MATLSFIGTEDHRITLLTKDTTTIGRDGDFMTPGMHHSVSRLHCVLFEHRGAHTIRDLNSVTGTLLNGLGIGNSDMPLVDGDKIGLGNHVVVVYRKGPI
jgi:pSer/pThr/pTyr-binding forkhead associated (FHA) protein